MQSMFTICPADQGRLLFLFLATLCFLAEVYLSIKKVAGGGVSQGARSALSTSHRVLFSSLPDIF